MLRTNWFLFVFILVVLVGLEMVAEIPFVRSAFVSFPDYLSFAGGFYCVYTAAGVRKVVADAYPRRGDQLVYGFVPKFVR